MSLSHSTQTRRIPECDTAAAMTVYGPTFRLPRGSRSWRGGYHASGASISAEWPARVIVTERDQVTHALLVHVGGRPWAAGFELRRHQSSHRLTARTITMSAARIANPTNTSNGVTVMIAHLGHVAERHQRAGRVLGGSFDHFIGSTYSSFCPGKEGFRLRECSLL
jgi:hypothetical protein